MRELSETARTVWNRVRDELHYGHVGWSFLTFFMTITLVTTLLFQVFSLPVGFLILALPLGWVGMRQLQAGRPERGRLTGGRGAGSRRGG